MFFKKLVISFFDAQNSRENNYTTIFFVRFARNSVLMVLETSYFEKNNSQKNSFAFTGKKMDNNYSHLIFNFE